MTPVNHAYSQIMNYPGGLLLGILSHLKEPETSENKPETIMYVSFTYYILNLEYCAN